MNASPEPCCRGNRAIHFFEVDQAAGRIDEHRHSRQDALIAKRVIHPLDRGAMKDWIDGCGDPTKGKEVLDSLAGIEAKNEIERLRAENKAFAKAIVEGDEGFEADEWEQPF